MRPRSQTAMRATSIGAVHETAPRGSHAHTSSAAVPSRRAGTSSVWAGKTKQCARAATGTVVMGKRTYIHG